MTILKTTLAVLAVGALTVSPFVSDAAFAKKGRKTETVKSAPSASEVETGQLLIKTKPVAVQGGAAENDLCGLPYTPKCITDASAAEIETGQLLIREKPAANMGGDTPADAPTTEIETGQLLDKGPRWPNKAAAADDPCKRPGTQCDPRDFSPAAKKEGPKGDGESGKTLGIAAGLGALLAGIVVASGGDDNPTSP